MKTSQGRTMDPVAQLSQRGAQPIDRPIDLIEYVWSVHFARCTQWPALIRIRSPCLVARCVHDHSVGWRRNQAVRSHRGLIFSIRT